MNMFDKLHSCATNSEFQYFSFVLQLYFMFMYMYFCNTEEAYFRSQYPEEKNVSKTDA